MAEADKWKNNGIPFSFSRYFRFPTNMTGWDEEYVDGTTVRSEKFSTGIGLDLQMQMNMYGISKWGRLTFVLNGKLDSPNKIRLCETTMNISSEFGMVCTFQTEVYPEKLISSTPQFEKIYDHVGNYQAKPVYILKFVSSKIYNPPPKEASFPNTFYLSTVTLTVTVKGKIFMELDVVDDIEKINDKSTQVPETAEEVPAIEKCKYVKTATTRHTEFHLSALLENPQYSDVDICVNGENFPAHKAILCARSQGFAEMLQNMESKNGNNPVNIITIDAGFSADVVENALYFIYTGTCANLADMSPSLLSFADKFKMDDLKILCESELQSTVTVINVCHLLDLAEKCNAVNLKSCCNDFFKCNSKEVTSSESWKELKQCNPNAIIALFENMLHERE